MAKQVTLLKVFVASPGDVEGERKALEQIINELNVTLGKTREIRLELVKWETHTYPGVSGDSGDVQNVINEQLGDDYDVFIGILWKRFGTPTPRAESGTEEEFNRAYKKYKDSSDAIRVMLYFKEASVSLYELDLEQVTNLKQFRESLGEKGALYSTYTELDEFTNLVRIHLILAISDFGKTWGLEGEVQKAEKIELPEEDVQSQNLDFEDYGYLDLIEIGVKKFEDATETTRQITAIMKELTARTKNNTAEFTALPKPKNAKSAKRIINRSAEDLEHFAIRLRTETPRLTEQYSTGISSYSKATELRLDFEIDDKADIKSAMESVQKLKKTLYESQQSLNILREAIGNLPRMTTKLNHAKRNALSILDEYIDDMTGSINLTVELEKSMKRIVDEGENNPV